MLLKDCQHIANTMAPDDVYQEPFTKSRNRLESRQVSTFFYPLFTHLQDWDLVKVVVKVVRHKQLLNVLWWKIHHNYDQVPDLFVHRLFLSTSSRGMSTDYHAINHAISSVRVINKMSIHSFPNTIVAPASVSFKNCVPLAIIVR